MLGKLGSAGVTTRAKTTYRYKSRYLADNSRRPISTILVTISPASLRYTVAFGGKISGTLDIGDKSQAIWYAGGVFMIGS